MNNDRDKDQDTLLVLTEPEAETAGIGDFLIPTKISVNKMSENLKAFTKNFGKVLTNINILGPYSLSEVTIQINVTASGEIQLIGIAKGQSQIMGGITLKFQKS